MAIAPMDGLEMNKAPMNVDNEYELRYWCEKLHCTPMRLRAAVVKVGTDVAAVRAELAKYRVRAAVGGGDEAEDRELRIHW